MMKTYRFHENRIKVSKNGKWSVGLFAFGMRSLGRILFGHYKTKPFVYLKHSMRNMDQTTHVGDFHALQLQADDKEAKNRPCSVSPHRLL